MKIDAPRLITVYKENFLITHVKKFVFSKSAAIQPAALLFPLLADFFQTFFWLLCENDTWEAIQKQPSIGVLIERCFENMQEIYRRTNVPKCDFNNVTLQNSRSYEHLWRVASGNTINICQFIFNKKYKKAK